MGCHLGPPQENWLLIVLTTEKWLVVIICYEPQYEHNMSHLKWHSLCLCQVTKMLILSISVVFRQYVGFQSKHLVGLAPFTWKKKLSQTTCSFTFYQKELAFPNQKCFCCRIQLTKDRTPAANSCLWRDSFEHFVPPLFNPNHLLAYLLLITSVSFMLHHACWTKHCQRGNAVC